MNNTNGQYLPLRQPWNKSAWAHFCSILSICLLCLAPALTQASVKPFSIAFYYGSDPYLDELHAYSIVVVDPDNGFDPSHFNRSDSELYAYVSIGEVHPGRSWAKDIPGTWKVGHNTDWQSWVMDQRNPDWHKFLLDRVIQPLWSKGYRGFFLDTLDSWQLAGKDADPAAQQDGLVSLIHSIHERFPGIRLIANRGFELLPRIAGDLQAVAAESLFQGWNQASGTYTEISAEDRNWLITHLNVVKDHYHLPVIAIDYVAPDDRTLMRDTARRIQALGFTPWVSSGALDTLGMGNIEVIPRRILIVYNHTEAPGMHYRAPHLYVQMLLNYMGYIADYADAAKPLPKPDPGVYAGIVSWLDRDLPPRAATDYARWLQQRISEHWKIALFDTPGILADSDGLASLGLSISPTPVGRLQIRQRSPYIGYETQPLPSREDLQPLRILQGRGTSWLHLQDAEQNQFDGAGLMPWGGFVWRGFSIDGDDDNGFRWVINPWEFLKQALNLQIQPAPDTTTATGRRMFFAHMDGDGFPSRAEFPGSPYAAQVVLDQILKRYPNVPHTMSVIEGEVSPEGLYPKDSPALEAIARKIFALPNVEIASHTYSHPFRWAKVESQDGSEDKDADYHLAIPNYVPSLKREVDGSVAYIKKRLAPPGKPVSILLWSGDAAPTPTTLAYVEKRGLLNMNGGETMPTKASPSLTNISPLGARLGHYFQVFAPVTNENVYTNLWRGPFYGFRRVTETFEITGTPRRIKPIDIYFHTYSASKPASLKALQSAYDWALARPVHPVFASEFMKIAESFNHVVLGHDLDGRFIIANAGDLRSVRLPMEMGEPDLASSKGIAGWGMGPDGRYLILSAPSASFRLSSKPNTLPYLAGANADVKTWQRQGRHIRAQLSGFNAIDFDLGNAGQCAVKADNQILKPSQDGQFLKYKFSHASATLDISCR